MDLQCPAFLLANSSTSQFLSNWRMSLDSDPSRSEKQLDRFSEQLLNSGFFLLYHCNDLCLRKRAPEPHCSNAHCNSVERVVSVSVPSALLWDLQQLIVQLLRDACVTYTSRKW